MRKEYFASAEEGVLAKLSGGMLFLRELFDLLVRAYSPSRVDTSYSHSEPQARLTAVLCPARGTRCRRVVFAWLRAVQLSGEVRSDRRWACRQDTNRGAFAPIRPMQRKFMPGTEKKRGSRLARRCVVLGCSLTGVLAGCGVPANQTSLEAAVGKSVLGQVHGGQQAVSGATIQLYAASGLGDGFASTPLLTQTVKTNAGGGFDLSHLYKCPSAGALVYLTATGGNPGLASGTNNRAIGVMAALGACGDLGDSTFISMNEVTTVAAVWALAPFMTSYAGLGSGPGDEGQLALAFQQAALLVDTAEGEAPGVGLPAGVSAPVAEMNTLGDVLAPCINSTGGVVGDGSACGALFAAAQPAGSAAATDTVGAALQIAKNPMVNVGGLYNLAAPAGPFQPTLSAAPASWAVALSPSLFQVYVDAASGVHAIDPNIYGIVSYGLDPAFAAEIKVSNQRWGGDGTTRYNWQVDASNAGFDWFFMGGNGGTNPVPGASADAMVRTAQAAGGQALMTIPIIPYVNRTAAWNCSFPVRVYGAQQATNPYVFPNGDTCGNSISASGTQLADTDILANNVPNTTALQGSWIQHLVDTFGTAAQGGVALYQLDNEPLGWGNTHRDVEPGGPSYSTIVSLGQQYAAAIKEVDATAKVLGPSDFTLGGWIGSPGDQGGLLAGQYYLQQMGLYDQAHGGRILDYFDEHYYPDTSTPTLQLAATRTLWDATYDSGTWVEQYFFNGPMNLIPRFKQWIGQYDPGTKLAFSEYSVDSGRKQIADALAEADMLGIFGQQGVDLASMWSPPAPTDPIAYAFRLYRDYDGNGGQFGETGLQAVSSDQTQLAVYGATRASDGALTLVVLNKTPGAIVTSLSLAGLRSAGSAQFYQYSGANLEQIVAKGSVGVVGGTLGYSFPAYSATVVVVAP